MYVAIRHSGDAVIGEKTWNVKPNEYIEHIAWGQPLLFRRGAVHSHDWFVPWFNA